MSAAPAWRLAAFDRAARGEELAELLGLAFHFPPADAPAWWDRGGDDQLRLLETADGRLAGTLMQIPMGHFLLGGRVSACGVAGVAVAHEFRGRGAGTWMMREALRGMRADGYAISSLYPSTIPLYRKAGYELAGIYATTRIPLRAVGVRSGGLRVRPATEADHAPTEALYRRVAAQQHGWLDRGRYLWSRVRHPRSGPAHGFVVEGPEGIEGYLWYVDQPGQGWKADMVCTDLLAATPAGGRELLGLLAANGTMHEAAVCHLPPDDPVLQLVPEHCFRSHTEERWMVRVLDPAAAVAQRGWPAATAGALELELSDDLFPENEGCWRLEVTGGAARLERGGRGSVRLDVRQLAQLLTGYQTPAGLARSGLVEAPPADLALAAALFAAPQPQLTEMF